MFVYLLELYCASESNTENDALKKNVYSIFYIFPLYIQSIQTWLFLCFFAFLNLRFRELHPEAEQNRLVMADLRVLTVGISQWKIQLGPGWKSRGGWRNLSCQAPTSQFQCCDSALLHNPGSLHPSWKLSQELLCLLSSSVFQSPWWPPISPEL